MCSPGIALGGLQAVGGVMQAQGQYNAQKAAADRQNQIQKQQYEQQLRITKQKSDAQKDAHAANLEAHAQAVTNFNKQLELNQRETDRVMAVASQKRKEADTKTAFALEAAMSKSIQAQGKMLSTGNSGQSFLLQTQQHERSFGYAKAQLEQTLMDSSKTWQLEKQGIATQQYNRDASAYNNVPGMPQAPPNVHLPYKPIKVAGPSKMALMGAMVGSVAGGAGSAFKTQAAYNKMGGETKKGWGW